MIKKIYYHKTYKNHLFGRKKRSSFINKKFFFLLIVLFAVGLYYLLYSDIFQIQKTDIRGNENIKKDDIENIILAQMEKKRFIFFPQKNIFFLNKKEVEDIIYGTFALEDVYVKKNFFHGLQITLKEKKPFIVWIENKKSYYVDDKGTAISQVEQFDTQKENFKDYNILRHNIIYKNLPIIQNIANQKNYIINEIIINNELLSKIKKLIVSIKRIVKININFFEININEKYITIITAEGWKIYFSLEDDIDSQIKKLELILDNKSKVGKIIDYIDLRYGDKIFYK